MFHVDWFLLASKTSHSGQTGEKQGKRNSNCMDSGLNSVGGLTVEISTQICDRKQWPQATDRS